MSQQMRTVLDLSRERQKKRWMQTADSVPIISEDFGGGS
jgi:hypothetical protein